MDNLKQLLGSVSPTETSLPVLVADIFLAAVTASILAWFYRRYGNSLSNRQRLANNFLLIAVTTTLVIMVVKSSLALSLGLVGALSIVRFRAAIKEPEELAYLFLAIALGLGFGANQHLVTVGAFVVILLLVYLQHRFRSVKNPNNLHLSITFPRRVKQTNLKKIIQLLSPHCQKLDLKRFEYSKQVLTASFYVEYRDIADLQDTVKVLKQQSPSVQITFIDQSNILL